MENLIEIIQKYSLTVRCLPYIVEENWTYTEGQKLREDEELTYWKPTLKYFQKEDLKFSSQSAEKRMETFYNKFPNGRAIAHRKRVVEKGGWWYVKETKNTDSTVRFNREYDKFFAATLEEAIELFLKSKTDKE